MLFVTGLPSRIARTRSFPNRPRRPPRWLGDDAFGNTRGAERRDLDLLRGCDARERLYRPVVRRVQGRDGRRRVPGAEDEPAPRVGAGCTGRCGARDPVRRNYRNGTVFLVNSIRAEGRAWQLMILGTRSKWRSWNVD